MAIRAECQNYGMTARSCQSPYICANTVVYKY